MARRITIPERRVGPSMRLCLRQSPSSPHRGSPRAPSSAGDAQGWILGPSRGCSTARPPGFPRSRPLGTHRPLPSLWVVSPVGFWQNEHQYEPGKCFWYLALGSEELPSSRRLEGKGARKARQVLQKKGNF